MINLDGINFDHVTIEGRRVRPAAHVEEISQETTAAMDYGGNKTEVSTGPYRVEYRTVYYDTIADAIAAGDLIEVDPSGGAGTA